MTNNTAISPEAIPNLHTPLAFLLPETASQYELVAYVNVVTLVVSMYDCIQDWLSTLTILKAFRWDWLQSILKLMAQLNPCLNLGVSRVA